MSSYIEALHKLPPFVRKDIFRSQIVLPAAFLNAMAGSPAVIAAANETEEDQENLLDLTRERFDALTFYAQDFCARDAKGALQIPDHVYELFAYLCLSPDDETGTPPALSEKALALLADVESLKTDPYPRQADYASDHARLLFLLTSYFETSEYLGNQILLGSVEYEGASFEDEFLYPLRTLKKGKTKLEDDILHNICRLEFILDSEDDPYHSASLNFVRGQCQEEITSLDILKKLGIPSTKRTAAGLNIAHDDLDTYGISRGEKLLCMVQEYCGPVKLFLDYCPDAHEDFVTFALNYLHIQTESWTKWSQKTYGEDDAAQFELWHAWLKTAFKDPNDVITAPEKDMLSNIAAARDIFSIENISLLMQQYGREPAPLDYENSLVEAKADLLTIRNFARFMPAHNAHLHTHRDEMLRQAFQQLNEYSNTYPVLNCTIDMVKGTPIYEDHTP
jgi:hypothetical protein